MRRTLAVALVALAVAAIAIVVSDGPGASVQIRIAYVTGGLFNAPSEADFTST
jgi:hypothetical protein